MLKTKIKNEEQRAKNEERRTSRFVGSLLIALCSLLMLTAVADTILYTRAGERARVSAAVPETLNFQARLLKSNGAITADGVYSIQFNLYTVASGGTSAWTETQGTVQVKSGYLSVYLGSVNSTLDTLDWSQQYWLTMNVNGDGEMNPRLMLTSVPYAFRAGQADGITDGAGILEANEIVQLAPSSVQAVNTALAALRINQTGAGLLAQLQGNGSDVFTVDKTGAVTAGTYNTNTFTGTGLTFGGAGATTVQSANNQNLSILSQGTGVLNLTSGSGTVVLGSNTLQNLSSSLTLDVSNAGLSTFNIQNNNGANLANLDVEGAIFAGNANAFSVNSDGDITSVFTALNGVTTANGGSGVGTSTSLILTNAANFDIGNYVQMNSANCGGTGINPCYAKITAKVGNTLTITPALRWTTGSTVNEYHVPEIGGLDTSQALSNRYGRGYFISGVAAGNGTTFYNEDSIETSLTTFDLLNTGVTTLRIGGDATTLNIGNASGTTTIAGTVNFSGNSTAPATGTAGYLSRSGTTLSPSTSGDSFTTSGNFTTTGSGTISAAAGLTVLAGGLNLTNSGITNTGSVAGVTTLSASGAITAATSTNTINGLIINAGTLTGVTGLTFTSGALALGGGNISGVGTLGLSGAITGATATNTINGLIINSGALSGVSTINASGLVTSVGLTAGAGLIQGTGGQTLTGTVSINNNAAANTTEIGTGSTTGQITIGGGTAPLVINSTAFDVSSAGALSGITTIGLSGAITGATSGNTINGLIINSGALSAITGFNQTSGNFAMSGTGTFGTGTGAISLNGATSVTGTNTFTVGTGLTTVGGAATVTGLATLNGGLTMQAGDTFTFNADAITDLSGNGLAVTANALTINVQAGSGLTVAATGLTNRRDCANNQILKWATGGGGVWNCAADATGISDARLKTNVTSVESDMLSRISQVRIVEFDYDCTNPAFENMHCDTDRQRGVIAQELAELFPELVIDVNGHYEVDYRGLTLYNLKATGELAAKMENIEQTQPATAATTVSTGGALRLDELGALQNITGFQMISGGASVIGGIDNNSGGISETGSISGATSIDAQKLTLTANETDNILELKKDARGVFTVFNDGSLELRQDSTNSFTVKDSSGLSVFNIDTINGIVRIGDSSNSKTVLFTLDSSSMELAEDPPGGVNGASYYNTKLERFRCHQDNQWTNCLPVGTLNDPIALGRTVWSGMPSSDTEFPGEPRILPDLEMAHEFKLRMRLTTGAAPNAICRLQYADTDNGPWEDLADSGTGELKVDHTGTFASDWLKIKQNARKEEIVIRLMCKGGNGFVSPVFYGVSMQLR